MMLRVQSLRQGGPSASSAMAELSVSRMLVFRLWQILVAREHGSSVTSVDFFCVTLTILDSRVRCDRPSLVQVQSSGAIR